MIYDSNANNVKKLNNGYGIHCCSIILYFPKSGLICCNKKKNSASNKTNEHFKFDELTIIYNAKQS